MPTVTEKPELARRRGRYPREFRRDVAALVLDQHRTVADVNCTGLVHNDQQREVNKCEAIVELARCSFTAAMSTAALIK